MKPLAVITGIGSVSPFGTQAGLIPLSLVEPTAITGWQADGLRRAYIVPPFQPSSVVPGLKTRRLDRSSAWALVAASLALQDAGIDLTQVDRTRLAVVFATGFGCIELTEAFYQSAYNNGWTGTDPITFPETLANSPAGHVALFHGLQGPNITVSSKGFAGECAMLQATSLLRHGQADLVVVISGDILTRSTYEWYETARLLSPACFTEEPLPDARGFVPGEGMAAAVLEPEGKRSARSYARLRAGRWATGGDRTAGIREMLDGAVPTLSISAGNGMPCTANPAPGAEGLVAPDAVTIPAQPVALGIPDTGALLHLLLALSGKPQSGLALMLATSGDSGYAALLLDIL